MMKENIIACLENATPVNSPVVAFVTGVKTVVPARSLDCCDLSQFLRRPAPQFTPAGTIKSVDHAAHPHFKADQTPQLGRVVGKTRFVLLH